MRMTDTWNRLGAITVALGVMSAALAATPPRLWVPEPAAQIKADTPVGEGTSIALTCPRGGAVSGQAVVAADEPLTALTATMSDLKGPAGAVIPTPQVRYATRQRDLGPGSYDFGQSDTFDVLADTLIPGEKVQPVWVTVRVPATAAPGAYTGTLTVEAAGTKLTAPVALTVAAFTLKSPGERTFVHNVEVSQETLALRYGVAPYSDAHFALLERQVALQGELGNNVLYVPCIGKVYAGNEYGLMQVKKQGDAWVPDFTAFDRYFALYRKYCGVPKAVTLILTARYMNNRGTPDDTTETVWLTVRNDDGTLAPTKFRAYPENEGLWKGIIDGLQARLKDAGCPAGTLRLGDLLDRGPTKAQVEFFQRIAPGVVWSSFLHGYAGGNPAPNWIFETAPLSYGEYPDMGVRYDTAIRRNWDSPYLTLCSDRGAHADSGPLSAPFIFRCLPEVALGANNNAIGLARLGLDHWILAPNTFKGTIGPDGNPVPRRIFGMRYQPDGKIFRLYRSDTRMLTAAGPTGHLTLQRFEMLREGTQDTEARCFLEKSLVNPALKAKISDDLRKRCEALLIERINALKPAQPNGPFTNDGQWQERTARLYALADEMAKAIE